MKKEYLIYQARPPLKRLFFKHTVQRYIIAGVTPCELTNTLINYFDSSSWGLLL